MKTLLPLRLLVAPDRQYPQPLILYHGKGCPDGFAAALASGESNADPMRPGTPGAPPTFLANHAGGIAGGIATGQPVRVRVAFKPTSSILTPVQSITSDGQATEVRTKGRHDPCVGIRGVPVVEAMMALVLADHKLRHRGQCG